MNKPKKRILFLAANPIGTNALRLDEEARAIQEEIQRGSQRDTFEFVPRLAVQPLDLLRALRDARPAIVHFAGHAKADGIYLVNDDGLPAQVSRETLHETFSAAASSVQIVVLNGCMTDGLAHALCELVPACVGTTAAIDDRAARMFSVGFYGALACGESAARAYRHGRAAVFLAGADARHVPHLHHRRDVVPEALVTDSEPISSSTGGTSGPILFRPLVARPGDGTGAPIAPAVDRDPASTDMVGSLVVLQLSDLQFGAHGRFADCDLRSLAVGCRRALDEARAGLAWRESINLVLVTGDVAEAARPPEYAMAATFFRALADQLELPLHRFVFVPGNHDISWNKCREAEGQLDDGVFPASELRARLDDVKLAHFEKFLYDVHGGQPGHNAPGVTTTPLPHGAFIHDFVDLGVSVAALNSCERESHRRDDHVGAVGAEQINAVLDYWRGAPAQLLRVVALHHNPAEVTSPTVAQWLGFLRSSKSQLAADVVERIAADFVEFEGREHLHNLADRAQVSMIVHGHPQTSAGAQAWPWRTSGSDSNGETRILSAGSCGASLVADQLPKQQPLNLQLIRFAPAVPELQCAVVTYDPGGHDPDEPRTDRFLLDPVAERGRRVALSIPTALRGRFRSDAAREGSSDAAVERRSSSQMLDIGRIAAAYRARKAGSFERWDLRTTGPMPTVSNRPVEVTLDSMYIPLRFAARLDPSDVDRGAPITPDDLLRLRRQVIVGGAGSGKTTWMRWTFRRLIQRTDAIPFFLELRAIAAAWSPQDAGRSIESYLAGEVVGCGAPDPAAAVTALLTNEAAPKPVILFDGWDELGAHGERLRERLLEFCSAFPRAVVVVSSRPYGDTRPAGAEAFQSTHIQPLSDYDIRHLARRFFGRIHGVDDAAGKRALHEFMTTLAAAPDARSLADTALLLTMMLLLSREGPLPDRRHKLYTACLRNMLLHRVTQREHDRAPVDLDQWRPDDSEERLRVVAELAFRMQSDGYRNSRRAPMIRSWSDAMALLKAEWTQDQRERFLRWLVASAGVLVDRTDGSVHFAHLSFQEHLAAYYLFITRESEDRIAAVRAHMTDRNWWETLRLLAGLIGDHWPDKLTPVFAMLREDLNGYWVAGMIFADGTGREADFDAWAAELTARVSAPLARGEDCARAWAACKQSARRARLATSLESAHKHLHWLAGTWQASWCELANLDVPPAPALLTLGAPTDSGAAVARSRVRFGATASWPDAGELAMLRLWPSIRAAIGIRLQTAISFGAQLHEIAAVLPALLARATRPWSDDDCALMRSFVRDFGSDFGRNFGSYFVKDFIRYFIRDFGWNFIRDFSQEFGQYFGRHFGRDFGRDFDHDFARYFVRDFGRDFYRYFRHGSGKSLDDHFIDDFVRDLGGSKERLDMPWLRAFLLVEVGSVAGRAAPRAVLAHGEVGKLPLLALFRAACRASFAPDDSHLRVTTTRAAAQFEGDRLWPALARQIARISTAEDRALLEDLAHHPEQRPEPLSWGLRHYVRGDLAFGDGSIITLDELCAQIGLAPLPLLETMPDELDVSFDTAHELSAVVIESIDVPEITIPMAHGGWPGQ